MNTPLVDNTARSLEAWDQGHRLWVYTYDGYAFHPHFHPVRLPGGAECTMRLPGDHPWHEGMFFSWKYLNGCNVWEQPFDQPHGFPRHRSIETTERGFIHEIDWTDSSGTVLVHENRAIDWEWRQKEKSLVFDWDLFFEAALPVVECERELRWGGYGGLSVRCARGSLPEFLTAEGPIPPETKDANPTSTWVDLTYNPDGLPSRTWHEHRTGVAIFDHPSNPGHPTTWWLYGGMIKINASFLQRAPVRLEQDRPLRLRYRVVMHMGRPDPVRLAAHWTEFSAPS